MKYRQVPRILKEDGWLLKETKGSHEQYIHSVKKGKVTLPFHGDKDIPIRTLTSIFKQAGIKRPKA